MSLRSRLCRAVLGADKETVERRPTDSKPLDLSALVDAVNELAIRLHGLEQNLEQNLSDLEADFHQLFPPGDQP